jgi:two-component sensor histidine kinase
MLAPNAAQSYSNVIHELTTNAVKYGALTRTGGKVAVGIEIDRRQGAELLVLTWKESGGPPITSEILRGFGLTVIEDVLRYEFAASTQLAFETDGLSCRIEVPLQNVTGKRV